MPKKGQKLNRTFHLKLATITPDPGNDFKTLIQAAHGATRARDRRVEIEKNSGRYRVLNDLVEMGVAKDVCAASVFAFTMDANINAAEISAVKKSYPISVLAPPRDKKKHLEFVEGLIWMAALGDYVAVMANRAVSIAVLEDYFSRLLSNHLSQTVSVTFSDPAKPSLKSYDMSEVKNIVFNGGVDVQRKTTPDGSARFGATGKGWKVIEAVFKSLGAEPPDIRLFKGDKLDQLVVSVTIKALRKGEYAASFNGVRRIAEAFRDVENPPVRFEFTDGRKLDLNDLRISHTVSISGDNDIPSAYETQKLLDEWLRAQVAALENPEGTHGGKEN